VFSKVGADLRVARPEVGPYLFGYDILDDALANAAYPKLGFRDDPPEEPDCGA